MLNHALLPAPQNEFNEFNEFTTALRERILRDGSALVEVRCGIILRIKYRPITEGDNDEPLFYSDRPEYHNFSANGRAYSAADYDLIELID